MAGTRSDPGDDVALVRAVAAGSEDALAILYDRHVDAVFATASRLVADRQVAEEVVQETFLALWNRAELFDPKLGSLVAWLLAIARHRTVDRLRAAGRRPRLVPLNADDGESDAAALDRAAGVGDVLGSAEPGPGPEARLATVEVRSMIRAALGGMPEPERIVIVMAYGDGLTQSEIAERLGWPLGTVKTRTRRALLRLRDRLAEELGPEWGARKRPVPAGEQDGSR